MLHLNRFIRHEDTFERHFFVSYLIRSFSAQRILDFGGEGHLASFIPDNSVVDIANVNNQSTVKYDNWQIKVSDKSYDVVVSIDTFEHISRERRSELVNELCRIARKAVVIAVPYGSREHIEYEQKLYKLLPKDADPVFVSYLHEHVTYGLPSEEELQQYLSSSKSLRFYYAGFFDTEYYSKRGWRRWLYLGQRLRRNLHLSVTDLKVTSFPKCNRIYCVAELE
jgi:hypothetical protein